MIEITESALLEIEVARPAVERLSELGVRVAIDDFGIGYSTLSYLARLPIDIVKIDRSFVDRAPARRSRGGDRVGHHRARQAARSDDDRRGDRDGGAARSARRARLRSRPGLLPRAAGSGRGPATFTAAPRPSTAPAQPREPRRVGAASAGQSGPDHRPPDYPAPVTRAFVPDEILTLAHERARARAARDWAEADRLRAAIEAAGWKIADRGTDFALTPATPAGPRRGGAGPVRRQPERAIAAR